MAGKSRSALVVIFTTVFIDLIGFGMVVPLVAVYGKHYHASGMRLALLGAIYSLMQFFFAPLWGSLSDRVGRRPILLFSLFGSTFSYFLFGAAPDYEWLLIARAVGGICAANISTAQAYIADITTPENRAKGMGLIGAAFGLGFILGPPLGGIASAKIGLAAPGFIAAGICGINLLLAFFRLKESLPPEKRTIAQHRSLAPLRLRRLSIARNKGDQGFLLLTFFFITFAFTNMEQTFSLLFQSKFDLTTGDAGYRTGLVLMVAGLIGALIQGGLIRRLVPKYGEKNLLLTGLAFYSIGMLAFPYGPNYASYFFLVIPFAFGSGLANPSLSSLISRSASSSEQGEILGLSQGLGSLARAIGPFCGLLTFEISIAIPYLIGCFICSTLLFACLSRWKDASKS